MSDKPRTWCPQCGPGVEVSFEGYCMSCYPFRLATGPGADAALAALERVRELEAAQERTCTSTWTRTDEDEGWHTSHDEYLRHPDGGPWRYCEDCGGRIVAVDISQSA